MHPGGDPSRVYFGTDTHASGLLLGALLAFAWPMGRFSSSPRRGAVAMLDGAAVLGLAGVLAAMATFQDSSRRSIAAAWSPSRPPPRC